MAEDIGVAVLVFVVAVHAGVQSVATLGAGRRDDGVIVVVLRGFQNHRLGVVAAHTLEDVVTVFRASGVFMLFEYSVLVAEGVGVAVFVFVVTIHTGMQSIAPLGTGRLDNGVVIVVVGGFHDIPFFGGITARALENIVTVFRAGDIFMFFGHGVLMAKLFDVFFFSRLAHRTSEGLFSLLSTVRLFCHLA